MTGAQCQGCINVACIVLLSSLKTIEKQLCMYLKDIFLCKECSRQSCQLGLILFFFITQDIYMTDDSTHLMKC